MKTESQYRKFIENLIKLTQADAIVWKRKRFSYTYYVVIDGVKVKAYYSFHHPVIEVQGVGRLPRGDDRDLFYDLFDEILARTEEARKAQIIASKVTKYSDKLLKELEG